MYVKKIVEDNWFDVRSNDIEYRCENVIQVEAAIRKLNGQNKTSIYLEADGESSLTISGGNEDRFVAFVTIGVDDEFYNVVDRRQSQNQMIAVKAGGQWGEFPAKQCVNLEAALQAARQFAVDGGLASSVEWEKQT